MTGMFDPIGQCSRCGNNLTNGYMCVASAENPSAPGKLAVLCQYDDGEEYLVLGDKDGTVIHDDERAVMCYEAFNEASDARLEAFRARIVETVKMSMPDGCGTVALKARADVVSEILKAVEGVKL